MPRRELEPPTREGHTPQACAYASSATGANYLQPHHYTNAPKRVNSLNSVLWKSKIISVILHVNPNEHCIMNESKVMRIALDAMGSDSYPVPDVDGAILAAREFGETILIVGDENRIKPELAKYDTSGLKLEVIPASDVITMEDKPGVVGKSKPNSSMHVGMNLVSEPT